MRHPPARMTARRRAHRLAGRASTVRDLLSPPLLPFTRQPVRPVATYYATANCGFMASASRQRNGHPGC